MKKILVTGSAGFIGMHLSLSLLKDYQVIGIDNINNYYDTKLKLDRIKILKKNKNFFFYKCDLKDYKKIYEIFKKKKPDIVINLAAQAGVRYSLEFPRKYLTANIEGFFNILECCKIFKIKKLLYASSSSVYGENIIGPFAENQNTDKPLSIYAFTKKSNELMANVYNHLYNQKCIGMRFFTVYGPWGRPDMALFSFVKSILKKKQIRLYNFGNMIRDFTYIDDVVKYIEKIIKLNVKYYNNDIVNIGNNNPVQLIDFVKVIESNLNIKAKIKFVPKPKSDVYLTHANTRLLKKFTKSKFSTNINIGIKNFINWYKLYYNFK
jgi:UDP-glucuronate 4-epimerase